MSMAKVLSESKRNKVRGLADSNMATGAFNADIRGNLADVGLERKASAAKEAEAAARKHDKLVKSASAVYREILDYKAIVNTDGAEVEISDSKPEFNVTAIAKKGTERVTASESMGITGGWDDLFGDRSHLDFGYIAAERATKLVDAKHVSGQTTQVILDPGMVGLLSHEAIGHTVEADFVLSGSVAKDKVGTHVASELVSLVDSGRSEIVGRAGGSIPVDDEGVYTDRTAIIEKGLLRSYLHNRESAFQFDVKSTGNARAFTYSDEPLIRMRNTFVEPGNSSLEEMIKETKHGYLVRGPRNGQADANGEFMFGAQEAYVIENGQIGELRRGASISGNAFDVLHSVDMVGNRFEYDMGAGFCGKYQPAKVDGGGPSLRCVAIVGGLQ
jgi:TldD protein